MGCIGSNSFAAKQFINSPVCRYSRVGLGVAKIPVLGDFASHFAEFVAKNTHRSLLR